MADLITYSRINWEDAPSNATPVNIKVAHRAYAKEEQ